MNAQEIKLVCYYTEAEYLRASRLLTFRSSSVVIRLVVFFVVLVGGLLLLSLLLPDFPLWETVPLVLLLEAVLLYNVLVRVPRQYFRGDAKFRDQYEFTFSDEGISVKTKQIDSKLAWSLYTKVIEAADMYLLVYGKEVRMITIVPKRAFQDRMQENAFRELLRRHIADHSASLKNNADGKIEGEYKPSGLNPPDWR